MRTKLIRIIHKSLFDVNKKHYLCSMTGQYIIIAIVLTACVGYAGYRIYKEIKLNILCKNYGCAGCAFYEKCKKNRKK